MHSAFTPPMLFGHPAAFSVSALFDSIHPVAIASALALGAVIGACLPPMCEALATAALRSIGEETHNRSTDRRITLVMSVLCALVCGLCAAVFGTGQKGVAAFALSAALLVCALIDVRYRLLPDIVTEPLLWAGLLANTDGLFAPLPDAVIGATAGYVGLRAISCLTTFAFRSHGIGRGDVKLLAALGAWLGWAAIPLVAVIAPLSLAIWAHLIARGSRLRPCEPTAFGPFLALAGILGICLCTPATDVLIR